MASPEAGDSQYFFTWTLVDDSARAKTIHFITTGLKGEAWTGAILKKNLLSLKVNLMKCDAESFGSELFKNCLHQFNATFIIIMFKSMEIVQGKK